MDQLTPTELSQIAQLARELVSLEDQMKMRWSASRADQRTHILTRLISTARTPLYVRYTDAH